MIFAIMFFLVADKHLTWYENFEQGEKLFLEQQYSLAIPYLQAAIEAKDLPQQKAFTRAVQTIEYKPYYYLSLSLYKVGSLQDAHQAARKALAGEVVRNHAGYMDALSPIIEAHLDAITKKNQEYEKIQESLDLKLQFFQVLGDQDFEKATELLSSFSTDNQREFNELINRHRGLYSRRLQMDSLVERYRMTLTELIDEGKKAQAQALYDSMVPILSESELPELQLMIQAIPDPEVPEVIDQSTQVDAAESDKEIEQLISTMKQEQKELETLLARDQREISDLSTEIESLRQKNDAIPVIDLSPEITFTTHIDGRTLDCIGQFFVPRGFASGEIQVGEYKKPFTSLGGKRTASFKESFTNLKYGKGTVRIHLMDADGTRALKETPYFIIRPWYLSSTMGLILGVLILSIISSFLFWKSYRRRQAVLKHFNPYIAGVPVREKDMFFGRQKLMDRIEKLIQNNCLMIFGQRRIGKTSLLHQLHDRLKISPNPKMKFYPVFIDLQGVHESDLFHLIMGETLSSFPELEENLEFLFEEDVRSYSSRHFSKDLKKSIEFLQSKNDKHVHIVFLMDEVDAINDFSEKTNQKLRGIFMKTFSDHLSSIMAGIHLKKHWESSGSPWYNFFEEIPMTYIQQKAARDLITIPVKGVFTYDEDAIKMIIQESGCQPFLIQKICVSLINQQLEAKRFERKRFNISVPDVEKILETMRDERKIIEGVQNS